MRFAQISDLHFGSFSWNPLQLLSKRWIGNFNFLLNRCKSFEYSRLTKLIDLLKEQKVSHVIITGDFTVTARPKEFQMGLRYVRLLEQEGIEVYTVPGNHDHYTRRSFRRKEFYRYFPKTFDPKCPLNLRDHRVSFAKVAQGIWLLGLDTVVATAPFCAEGLFTPDAEAHLKEALEQIPKDEMVILFNHYPLFKNTGKRRDLIRAHALESLLKQAPNVELYLNGHTHRRVVADLRQSELPILSDTGSTSHVKNGGCHLFEIDDNAIELVAYYYDGTWKKRETHKFSR